MRNPGRHRFIRDVILMIVCATVLVGGFVLTVHELVDGIETALGAISTTDGH